MAEGRNIQGGAGTAGLRWWQEGSTEKKPTYFTKNASNKFWNKLTPQIKKANKYYNNQFKLIADRNEFYKSYNPRAKEPKATFVEAMRLANYGYTGQFGRSKSKQVLGLLGEDWQRAYALDRLRKNKDMLTFSLMNNSSPETVKRVAAADILRPGSKKYMNLIGLYSTFIDKYGAKGEGYVDRYNHLPTLGSKYGILFNTGARKIINDDANVTYQNNLVKASLRAAKEISQIAKDSGEPALEAAALKYAAYGDYRIKSSRGKYNPEYVKEMEQGLSAVPYMMQDIRVAMGDSAADEGDQSHFSNFATSVVSTLALGPVGGIIGQSEKGNEQASKAMDYMNGLAESDILAGRKTYWKSFDGGVSQFGLFGVQANLLRGVARIGLGLPTGLGLMADEAYLAGKETVKWKTNENYSWGTDTDFKLGDAIWADYAQRYYDPFAYDETGRFRGFKDGLQNKDGWDRFSEKFNNDPSAYVLDVLDVAPIVGVAAKSAQAASLAAKAAKTGGRLGVTAADRAAWKAGKNVLSYEEAADRLANIRGLEQVTGNKADAANIKAAEDAVNAARFDAAPSARNWRKTVRAAYNGDELAAAELSRWKAMGLEFDGLETGIGVRATALFEPRTKILDKPSSVLEASPKAVYRLPASPIARGAKEGFFWVGRGFDAIAQKAAEAGGLTGKVGVKMIDFPLLSYRYNYTKAIRNEAIYEWGDVNTELQRAARLMEAEAAADVTPTMRRAIIADLFGGSGAHPLQKPAIQRQQINDQINALPRDKDGNITKAAEADYQNLRSRLADLLDEELAQIDEAKAAGAFDEMFDEDLTRLRRRLSDSTFEPDDAMLNAAEELHRRLARQDEAVRNRIFHDDTTPRTVKHLEMLYTEAMEGLRLSQLKLFGKKGNTGRLGRYTKRVLRVNTNMLLRSLVKGADKEQIINMAQKADGTGTVFDDITDKVERLRYEQDMVRAFDALDDAENFVDGLGSYGTPGRPVLIAAKEQPTNPDFVSFHIPRLRHEFEAGKIKNGRLVDEGEVFTLPRVFFSGKKNRLVFETPDAARQLLYEGALNAMHRVYPEARYYSAKVNDTGQKGVRQNEKMIATENEVARTGLRQHALSRVVQSQAHYLRNRVERDLRGLAESQAVLVPAAEVSGKTARESGYQVLNNVRMFDNIEDALDFGRLRGVGKEVEQAFAEYADGTLAPIDNTLDLNSGMGVMMVDGEPRFVVRGGLEEWFNEALQEDLAKNTTLKSWINREFADPDTIPTNGYVLAVPNRVYKNLAETVLENDQLASRLLNLKGVKGWGNLFKWFVLNANPGFISNNVIGGMAMMMMYNPQVASRLLGSMIQKMARESIAKRINNDWFTNQLSTFKNDSESVRRQLAYEFEHNIYRQDAGLLGASGPQNKFKKYVWHGGYTVVSAWEEMMRNSVAMQFLRNDAGFQAFMRGPEVRKYIEDGVDWNGNVRQGEDAITPFEAATDLLLDRSSPFFNANLKHRMRYLTNTISGNYHYFTPTEQLMRNVVMPFYSWQRHSATFSYRMLVDRPITTNILYNLGEQGYQQNAEQGVPEWMMGTVPAPQVIKDLFDITDDDFRFDGGMLSPFGTTGDMGMAAVALLGGKTNASIWEFTNPYLNALIQDTLAVNPQTGVIDWERLKEDGVAPEGIFGMGKNMFTSMGKATYPYKFAELAKYNEYEQDALANQYATIDNASDILKNYDPTDPEDPWKLKIPNMRSTEAQDPTQRAFSALGIKTYRLNPNKITPSSRQDAVGAIVMKYINDENKRSNASTAVNSAQEWKRKYDYVTRVWLPQARAQGMNEAEIQMVLVKIMDEKPKRGIAKDLTDSMIGG